MNRIAEELGCTSQNVLYRVKQVGIPRRSRGSRTSAAIAAGSLMKRHLVPAEVFGGLALAAFVLFLVLAQWRSV